MNHLTENSLLSPNQFGFHPGKSTTDAISLLVDNIGLNMNNNQLTLATFIDFSKAFDTLDHNILIDRLTLLNLSPNTLSWFKSYLTNRSQQTLANDKKSEPAPIRTGVPQGSILGPLLFITYVNGMTLLGGTCKVIMYADDTVVYCPVDRRPTITQIQQYQKGLNDIYHWCCQGKLSINSSKTITMLFGKMTINQLPQQITIADQPLEMVTSYKYLGVTLNQQLTLQQHITSVIGHSAAKINLLAYLNRYVSKNVLIKVYKTTILSVIDYANILHPLIPVAQYRKLQSLQNRALRIIFSPDTSMSKEEMHIIAKLTSIRQRADKQILCLMFKRSLQPDIYPQVITNVDSRRTRGSEKIHFCLPRPTIEKFKKFPLYYGAQLWDTLGPDVQCSETYLRFKYRISSAPDFECYPV